MSKRPGFAFSTTLRVRYAEIDGQKVVFNSRYLEYADVALTDFWEWTGIADAVGDPWSTSEFHVRRAEVDYLKPFQWGDTIEAFVRVGRVGNTSMMQRLELCHAETKALHAVIEITSVNVHLPSGRPTPLPPEVRSFMEKLNG